VGEEVLDVYIGNLSNRVGVDDLRELFDGVSRRKSMVSVLAKKILANFGKPPRNTELQFSIVSDAQGRFMRYCRVSGYSRAAATRLITQLAGLSLHGRMLEVRPFYPRALVNDPRRAGWHFRRWLGAESRMADRRIGK
jgi:RNA recognition motif-containing protein